MTKEQFQHAYDLRVRMAALTRNIKEVEAWPHVNSELSDELNAKLKKTILEELNAKLAAVQREFEAL